MMDVVREFRSKERVQQIVKLIKDVAPKEKVKIMHVCGTHENSLAKYAIRDLLPSTVELIAGPGCPVCICPAKDIDEAIYLAKKENIILTTYGDMVRTPSTEESLWDARSKGADVQVVYSITDAIETAKNNPQKEVVFLSVGFETTTPGVAYEIYKEPPENFSILSSHRIIPPALDALLSSGEINIQAIIAPGHVSTIIGSNAFSIFPEKYKIPTAVVGFEPLDILLGIYMLLRDIRNEEANIINEYTRIVKPEGNVKAQKIIYSVFDVVDGAWRGIGVIPKTGLELKKKYSQYNAREKFEIKLEKEPMDIMPGCSCNKIMLGQVYPDECPLFGTACIPTHPVGPCMVSDEGTCKIWYKYNLTRK